MNQPFRTFLLIALVVLLLLAMQFLPTLQIGSVELRRVDMLSDVRGRATAADGYLHADEIALLAAAAAGDSTGRTSLMLDSLTMNGQVLADFSGGESGGLDHFFSQLRQAETLGRPVRIAYFGDSFIEGDILTCDLRELFQDTFGGAGVGWVDCGSRISGFRQTVRHQFSGLTAYEVVQRPFVHSCEGIAERYFTAHEGARITLNGSSQRKHIDAWQQATLYLRTDHGVRVTAIAGSDTLVNQLEGSRTLRTVTLHQPSMSRVSYRFDHIGAGTLLYGVALESPRGVIVDNFSMRGSSGTPLAQIPINTLRAFAHQRPYDLIVLHYGLNVASPKSHPSVYHGYIKQMGKAIDHLRAAFPEASFLVVSMPDRDQRTDAGLLTMRGVEALVACQQLMAREHGVAFFNLFQAMGGRESMATLVSRGMANKDYTHLSFAGGRHLARIIFDSLMAAMDGNGLYAPPRLAETAQPEALPEDDDDGLLPVIPWPLAAPRADTLAVEADSLAVDSDSLSVVEPTVDVPVPETADPSVDNTQPPVINNEASNSDARQDSTATDL